ncbi:MAG: asparagine synthase (glutamine-hydrolyzing) [Chloroflexota bacterium]|nr:asparagine synthase (glutamine-hydrolyzing) [Chloroflexota bacterium]MDQ5865260.1 asparagine synthase (glutamine-hydrolyzing) [Chloroflexota bacterium]
MCGICGIWHQDGKPVDVTSLRRATTAMRHRGPNDEGYLLVDTRSDRTVLCGGEDTAPELQLPRLEEFAGERFDLALGFRRLSILDISPSGHQPMPSHDGRCWIIFNGEVYNYLELRAELATFGHRFHTGSDTEVILAAYRQWGVECLSRFNGMWALAIWDGAQRKLFMARDRFGVKPLYMHASGNTLAFASEIKALLCANVAPFRPSEAAVAGYVARGLSPSHQSGETFFEGVEALPAAHYALVSAQGGASSAPRRYWSLPSMQRAEPLEQARHRYTELFNDAVRLRLRADVPVGTCLSGGLDSSSIVSVVGRLMQSEHAVSLEQLGERQQTFSAVYDTNGPWNETPYIESVLSKTGAGGNSVVPSGEGLWRDLEQLVWHQDEPFQSTSIFAQWCVMRLARERGVTVLLDGQGADEVLGGYRPFAIWVGELMRAGRLRHAALAMRDIYSVTKVNPATLLARAAALHSPGFVLGGLRNTRLRQAAATSGLRPHLAQQWLTGQKNGAEAYSDQRSLDTHLARLVEGSLPDLLRYEDRNSMAFSIEARLPFLDYRLVEYVFSRAAPYRIHKGWTKWLQRVAVESLLPAEVVWRRDKVGFETPEWHWLRQGSSRVLDILADDAHAGEYLDLKSVRQEVPRLLAQPGNTSRVWRWVNLTLWLRGFSRIPSAQ